MEKNQLVIPGISNPGTLACISRSRKYTQYVKAVEGALANRCPFCHVNRDYNKIVFENTHCYAWHCNPPEAHTKFHFLIVPKRHVTDSTELMNIELLWIYKNVPLKLMEEFGFKSRGVLIRDGDATLSAGTIEHLHAHIMVPDGTGRVESPFYKGSEAEEESTARAIVFEKLRQGIPTDSLSTAEKALVKDRV